MSKQCRLIISAVNAHIGAVLICFKIPVRWIKAGYGSFANSAPNIGYHGNVPWTIGKRGSEGSFPVIFSTIWWKFCENRRGRSGGNAAPRRTVKINRSTCGRTYSPPIKHWDTTSQPYDYKRPIKLTYLVTYYMVIRPPEVTETATKLSPAPLQKHSLDGCTVGSVDWTSWDIWQLPCGLRTCSICSLWPRRTAVGGGGISFHRHLGDIFFSYRAENIGNRGGPSTSTVGISGWQTYPNRPVTIKICRSYL